MGFLFLNFMSERLILPLAQTNSFVMNLENILGGREALNNVMDHVNHLFARGAFNAWKKGLQETVLIAPVPIDPYFTDYFEKAFGVNIKVIVRPFNETLDLKTLTALYGQTLGLYTQDIDHKIAAHLMANNIDLQTNPLEIIRISEKNYQKVKQFLPVGLPKNYRPGTADLANDKAVFQRIAEAEGIATLSGTELFRIFNKQVLQASVESILSGLESESGLFVRASKAGGGMGNLLVKKIDLDGTVFYKVGKEFYRTEVECRQTLAKILESWARNKSREIVVAPYYPDIQEGPSVYAEIDQNGEVHILRTFAQILDPENNNACVGMKYPNDLGFDDEMIKYAKLFGQILAGIDYEGRFNLDFVKLSGKLFSVESNVRQTAGNPIHQICNFKDFATNIDHTLVHTSFQNLAEIETGLRILGIPILGDSYNPEYSEYGFGFLTGMNYQKTTDKNGKKYTGEIAIIAKSDNQEKLNYWVKLGQYMITNGLLTTKDYKARLDQNLTE